MESRELPKRIFKSIMSERGEKVVQDLLNQGYRIESMTVDERILYLYLTLDPKASQPADPKS